MRITGRLTCGFVLFDFSLVSVMLLVTVSGVQAGWRADAARLRCERKTPFSFLAIFYAKNGRFLPRQARDKRRGKAERKRVMCVLQAAAGPLRASAQSLTTF